MRKYLPFLFLFLHLSVMAQPHCHVRMFNLRDGLASNIITSMEQTPDQLMWFSSWNGLSCYDGYAFTTFSDKQGASRSLTTNRLLKISPSETGNIWCLTYDRQVFLFDRSTCRFINVSEMVSRLTGNPYNCQRIVTLKGGAAWLFNRGGDGGTFRIDERQLLSAAGRERCLQEFSRANGRQKGDDVYGVEQDEKGREWLLTEGGITLVEPNGQVEQGRVADDTTSYSYVIPLADRTVMLARDGRIGFYDEQSKAILPMAGAPHMGAVRSICRVPNGGGVVALTDEGLLLFASHQKLPRCIPLPQAIEARVVQADSRGRVWLLGGGNEVLMVNPGNGLSETLTTGHEPDLAQSTRNFLHEDRYGYCWIGCENGFFGYYDEQRHQLVAQTIRQEAAQPSIDRWYVDARGDLWFSGEHDVAVVNFSQPVFTQVNLSSMQQVRSLCYDSHGRLWAGDIAGHVVATDGRGQALGYLGPDGQLHSQPTVFSTHIYCIVEDGRQRLWIGTKGDGLYCLSRDGQLSHYQHAAQQPYSLPSNQIYDVHEDLQHRLWVGTFERGIAMVEEQEDGTVSFIHADNLLSSYPVADYHKVRRITETADGIIIVSASNGLVTFSERFSEPSAIRFYAHKHIPSDTTSLHTSDVMHTYVAHSGHVLVATVGGGMQEVDDGRQLLSSRLHLKHIGRVDDQLGGTILSMLEDSEGSLWIGRENSLAMYQPSEDQLWLFGPGYLGDHTELTEAKPAMDIRTGQMVFATTNGYVTVRPELTGQEAFVPPIVFKSVFFHGQNEPPRVLSSGERLEVPANQRNLTIHFAALDYQDNYMIRYAYRMEGEDSDWNQLEGSHSISFSHLPAGHHRLLVRSTNQYGVWVDNARALDIYVHPTFWETGWAWALYVLLAIGIVAIAVWIYRLRTNAAAERQKNRMLSLLLAEMKEEKARDKVEETAEQKAEKDEAGEETGVLHLRPTAIVDTDKLMMEQLLVYIEDHLADPDLKVEELAQAVCLGRTAFYNKVKALVGMSPVELLRHVRIQHAEDMVAHSSEPFSQIAYAVGFSDSRYFGKCFKKQTGLTPSEYREMRNEGPGMKNEE